jgi:hypothetical protein
MKTGSYFPHFENARNDNKILKIRRKLGLDGYAVYFMILEVLRAQSDFKLSLFDIEELEFDFRTDKQIIISIIHDFDLFIVENGFFYSKNLIENLKGYLEKSDRARNAALKRWNNANADANADANQNANADANADANQNAIKLNITKLNLIELNKTKQNDFLDDSEKNFYLLKWINYRKELKQPLTEITISQLCENFKNENITSIKYKVEKAIENGWKGLAEEKEKSSGKKEKYEFNPEILKNPNRLKF